MTTDTEESPAVEQTEKKPRKNFDQIYSEWVDAITKDPSLVNEDLAKWLINNDRDLWTRRCTIEMGREEYREVCAGVWTKRKEFKSHARFFCDYFPSRVKHKSRFDMPELGLTGRQWERLMVFIEKYLNDQNSNFKAPGGKRLSFFVSYARLFRMPANVKTIRNCSLYKKMIAAGMIDDLPGKGPTAK